MYTHKFLFEYWFSILWVVYLRVKFPGPNDNSVFNWLRDYLAIMRSSYMVFRHNQEYTCFLIFSPIFVFCLSAVSPFYFSH